MNDIISKILAIEAEQVRRACPKLDNYNKDKVHEKQMQFHKNLCRNRWVFGGNRTGKTECGAVEAVWLCRGIHPYRPNRPTVEGWVVSLSTQVQRDVAQAKILSYLSPQWIHEVVMISGSKGAPAMGVIDYIVIKNVLGGFSRIGFKSCDQGREKFQGASLDFVWFDEEPPADIYSECRMRVLDRCGIIFGTMTPLKGLTWVYDEIYLSTDPEVWHISMEWADNPYLDQDETKALNKSLSADELDSRRYGRFKSGSGMVYGEFDPAVHVIEPFSVPYEWYDNISIDPGLKNPLSVHWYASDGDGNVYVVAEHYEAERDVVYHAEKIKEICKKLNWHTGFDGRIEALIDSAASQRTLAATKSVSELFFEQGIAVNPKVDKNLFSGISRVKSYLKTNPDTGKPSLYIFSCCSEMIREFKSYFWGAGDTPRKVDDHAMDELRYYICSRQKPKPVKKPKTAVQRDKERLIKKLKG